MTNDIKVEQARTAIENMFRATKPLNLMGKLQREITLARIAHRAAMNAAMGPYSYVESGQMIHGVKKA